MSARLQKDQRLTSCPSSPIRAILKLGDRIAKLEANQRPILFAQVSAGVTTQRSVVRWEGCG